MMRGVYISLIVLLFFHPFWAEANMRVGLLPAINLNKRLESDWRLNFKSESRFILSEGELSDLSPIDFTHQLTEISGIVSKKVGLNNSLAAGYLAVIREDEISHRLIQQFTIVQRYNTFRLAHRFAGDQTFSKKVPAELRIRYRIASDFPLNGNAVDPGEFYFKAGNEYLLSFQESESDLEIRLTPHIGYAFTDSNKIEGGIDYRINSFLISNSRQSLWLSFNWYFSF